MTVWTRFASTDGGVALSAKDGAAASAATRARAAAVRAIKAISPPGGAPSRTGRPASKVLRATPCEFLNFRAASAESGLAPVRPALEPESGVLDHREVGLVAVARGRQVALREDGVRGVEAH